MAAKSCVCCVGYCEDWEPLGPGGGTLADGTTWAIAGAITNGDPTTGDIEWDDAQNPMTLTFSAPVQIRIAPYGISSSRIIWHEVSATQRTKMSITGGGGCDGWVYTPGGDVDLIGTNRAELEDDGYTIDTVEGVGNSGINVNADWGTLYASHVTEFQAFTNAFDAARFEVAPLVLGCKKDVCEVIGELRNDICSVPVGLNEAETQSLIDDSHQTLSVDCDAKTLTISEGNSVPLADLTSIPRIVYSVEGVKGLRFQLWTGAEASGIGGPGNTGREAFEQAWSGPPDENGVPTHVNGAPTRTGQDGRRVRFVGGSSEKDESLVSWWVHNNTGKAIELSDVDTRADSIKVYAGCDCDRMSLVFERFSQDANRDSTPFLTLQPGELVKVTVLIHDPGDFSGFHLQANFVGETDLFDPDAYMDRPVIEAREIVWEACDPYELEGNESWASIDLDCWDCHPQPTVTVDRTSLYRATVTETDMHDDGDTEMDLAAPTTAEDGWVQGPGVHEVTWGGAADRVEGHVNITATDDGASSSWSRPYVAVEKNGDRIAWIDAGSVMQDTQAFSGRAVFTGSFVDDNPQAGDVYAFTLVNEDARTATLLAAPESHVALVAVERVEVKL